MDGPGKDADAERAELTALRRRAYAADADIHSDPAALARLAQLEERALPVPAAEIEPAAAMAAIVPAAEPSATVTAPGADHRRGHGARPRTILLAAAGVVVIAVGAAIATGQPPAPTSPVGADDDARTTPSATPAQTLTPAEARLDTLRRDVLAGAEPDNVAGRVIRDELVQYGTTHGWSVWAGPTIDHAFCLVVGSGTLPTITCGTPEFVLAHGLSVVVPAAEGDTAGAEPVTQPGQPLRITLLPGGAGMTSAPEPGS